MAMRAVAASMPSGPQAYIITGTAAASDVRRRSSGAVTRPDSPTLPHGLHDHTPLYYVLHVWNDFAAHPPGVVGV